MWNLSGLEKSTNDETDFCLGWRYFFVERGIDINASLGYWDIGERFSSNPQKAVDYLNLVVQISKKFKPSEGHTLSPYFKVSLVQPVDTGNQRGYEGGAELTLGTYCSWKIGDLIFPVSVWNNVRMVHDSGLYGGDVAWIGRITGGLDWQINDLLSMTLPGFDFSQPVSSVEDGRGTELIAWVGMTLYF